MEFERIGKNTVQCHMTVEEMNEYGLHIEDFFTNQEKSREFLEHLVEKAEEEIGYEVESGMISMQLMRMPDDSLIITFSDKGEEGIQNMLSQLQNLAGMMDEKGAGAITAESAAASETTDEEVMKEFHRRCKEGKEELARYNKSMEKKRQEKLKKDRASKIYCFSSLSRMEDFAATVTLQKNIPSKIYKDDKNEMWYLLIKKGKLRLDEYQMVCHKLLEYSSDCVEKPFAEQYCKEHFRCVIAKRALAILREYQSDCDTDVFEVSK